MNAAIQHRHTWIETDAGTDASVRLHVVEAGPPDGQPVILLHGFSEFWYGWHRQIPALVRAGRRVVVPDQRGYHWSSKPRGIDAYRIQRLARDVEALIDYTGHTRADVVGHDWGAMVAWALAASAPHRVRRLGILNVPHPHVMVDTLRTRPAQRVRSLYAAFFQLPHLPEWLLGRCEGAGLALMMRMSSKADTFSEADWQRYRVAWRQPGALRGMLNWYRAAAQTNAFAQIPTVPIEPPTLVLWGKQDVALCAEMAAASVARCTNGRLVTFHDATHWVQHDMPEQVNRELIAFLGS